METVDFRYHLLIEFDQPVTDHRFTVKCMPRSDSRQTILSCRQDIYPEHSLCEGTDAFGNLCVFGHTVAPHEKFEVLVSGVAVLGLSPAVPAGDDVHLGLYRYPSAYTRPGPALTDFFQSLDLPEGTALDRARYLAHAVHEAFTYAPGTTDIHTTAEQAMARRQGVCQDYAHAMLALCRMAGIPCRYVVGMLMGEGQSHAWAEIADGGYWYGLDPTNDIPVDSQHIKLSHGRDYGDCLINQGLFTGSAAQRQSVSVRVEKQEGEAL